MRLGENESTLKAGEGGSSQPFRIGIGAEFAGSNHRGEA